SYNWSIAGDGAINGSTTNACVTVDAGLAGSFTLTLEVVDFNGCENTCDVIVDVVGTGMVGDFIWEDLDADGIQDPGEPGIPDIALSLFRKDGGGGQVLIAQTTTDAAGAYLFDGLCAGDYNIVVTPPPGPFAETTPNVPPDDTVDSNCIGGIMSFNLPTDATIDLTIDCGFVRIDEERAHPGWNWVDNLITLTHNEPTDWSALTGEPKHVSPFTIPYPSPNPLMQGRPAMDGTNDGVLCGYVYEWAVDAQGREICWNHLKGDGTLINYRDGAAWEYNAWSFQAVNDPATICQAGGLLMAPFGQLDLNGFEYVRAYNQLLLDFYASGSQAISGGSPFQLLSIDTDLTLHPVGAELTQDGGPLTTKATFVVWNENETQFTGLHRCITCWDQTLLSLYTDAQNHFLAGNLQTDKGKARIDGEASILCSSNCCIPRATGGCASTDCQELVCAVNSFCCTTAWTEECAWIAVDLCDECDGLNVPAPLLGVAAKQIALNGGLPIAASGLNLIGMGVEAARIRHDILGVGNPPPATTPEDLIETYFGTVLPVDATRHAPLSALLPAAGPRSPRDGAGAGPAAAAGPAPGSPDRVSGTEKGSLLIFSKVEIRWDAAGNVVQDTFLDISNDWIQDVQVKMYFINGDPPLDAMAIGP
ncbi:MAG: SdrD B-like domain-containing protein, partial [Planctomycetota bacterium]